MSGDMPVRWAYIQYDPERELETPKAKRRKCLKCDAEFDSYYGNRLCDDCRAANIHVGEVGGYVCHYRG